MTAVATTGLAPRGRKLPQLLGIWSLGYLLLVLGPAWRVVRHFTSELAGNGGDAWQNLWNMEWVAYALQHGQNPYVTNWLHHPHGTTLLFHTLSPANALLAWPLAALMGQPAAYNAVFLFAFVAAGSCMALLAFELGTGAWPAFVGGAIFTLSPYHFAHSMGHLNLTAMQWVPLFLWCVVRFFRAPSYRRGLSMGAVLALVTFTDLYYLWFAGVMATVIAVAEAWQQRAALLRAHVFKTFAAGVLVFLVSGGVLLGAVLWSYPTAGLVTAHQASMWGADMMAYLVPNWISAWQAPFAVWQARWGGNQAENSQYLGYVAMTLAGFGWLRPSGVRPWRYLTLFGIGVLLSLGPVLHWGGQAITWMPMPYRAVEGLLPILKLSGAPTRWCFVAVTALPVLAAFGVRALLTQVGARRWGPVSQRAGVAVAVLGLVVAEFWPRSIETRATTQPGFITVLAQDPRAGAVYDQGGAGLALFHQLGHRRPLIGGYISRETEAARGFVAQTPVLQALRGERLLASAYVSDAAAALGLRFVIVPRAAGQAKRLAEQGLLLWERGGGYELWEIPWPPQALP